jgi:hypothetical protein
VNIGSLKKGLTEKSKLAEHACEGQRVGWNKARILEIEGNSSYRKYKKSAYMTCSTNSVSQPNLNISPYGLPLSTMRLGTHRSV